MHRPFLLVAALAACSSNADAPADASMSLPDAEIVPIGDYDPDVSAADVSILYPLDAATDPAQLVGANANAAWGPLLPQELPDGASYGLDATRGGDYASMRLVGLRLDPCSARGGCIPEVRAVFQPVGVGTIGTEAFDGAVHAFYAMPAEELSAMLQQILTLKKAYGEGVAYPDALGAQPILVATGLDGEFARGLRLVILEHLGKRRLERMTLMAHLNNEGDAWTFSRFDRVANTFVATTITGTTSTQQGMSGSSALSMEIGVIYGGPSSTPTVPTLAALVDASRPQMPAQAQVDGFAAAVAVQDPAKHHSEDTDCSSCHLAEGAVRVGVDLYGMTPSGGFASARSLDYMRQSKPLTNLHAFGYIGTSISVMQRTANESAVVADAMQSALTSPF